MTTNIRAICRDTVSQTPIPDDIKLERSNDEALVSSPNIDSLHKMVKEIKALITEVLSSDRHQPKISISKLDTFLSSFLQQSELVYHSGKTQVVQSLRLRVCDLLLEFALTQQKSCAFSLGLLIPHILNLLHCAQISTTDCPWPSSDAEGSFGRMQKIAKLAKEMFELSRSPENDHVLISTCYLEAVLRTSLLVSDALASSILKSLIESLTFFYATFKNVSQSEEAMLVLLGTNGAITIMGNALKWCTLSAWGSCSKQVVACLIQVTSILRNLISVKAYLKQFQHAKIMKRLCVLLGTCKKHHLELIANITRALSKLTLHERFRCQFNDRAERNMQCLTNFLPKDCDILDGSSRAHGLDYWDSHVSLHNAVCVRILFVMGNLCAGNDTNRNLVAYNCGGISVLSELLQSIMKEFSSVFVRRDEENEDRAFACLELLVRLTRLLANLSISPAIAEHFAFVPSIDILFRLLEYSISNGSGTQDAENKFAYSLLFADKFATYTSSRILHQREELVLNIISCITNMSYQPTLKASVISQQDHWIQKRRVELTEVLSDILSRQCDEEFVLETARAFGNLTRFDGVLDILVEKKLMEIFIQLLRDRNEFVMQAICGVLINASLHARSRCHLLHMQIMPESDDDNSFLTTLPFLTDLFAQMMDESQYSRVASIICYICKILHNLICLTKKEDQGDSTQYGQVQIVDEYITSESAEILRATLNRAIRKYACVVDLCSVAIQLEEKVQGFVGAG